MGRLPIEEVPAEYVGFELNVLMNLFILFLLPLTSRSRDYDSTFHSYYGRLIKDLPPLAHG